MENPILNRDVAGALHSNGLAPVPVWLPSNPTGYDWSPFWGVDWQRKDGAGERAFRSTGFSLQPCPDTPKGQPRRCCRLQRELNWFTVGNLPKSPGV